MIKVMMMSIFGQKTDLFSEHTSLRDVFNRFHVECVGTANGVELQEEDFDKSLLTFSEDAEVAITAVQKSKKEEETIPEPGPVIVNCTHNEVKEALLKVKEALDAALMALEEEELPF